MEKVESLREYYDRTGRQVPKDLRCPTGPTRHFNILKRINCCSSLPFQRRDYYKICLLKAPMNLHTENNIVASNGPCIIFSNPQTKYGWESLGTSSEGYVCLFNENYLSSEQKAIFVKLFNLFEQDSYPLIPLQEEEYTLFLNYFHQMEMEYNSQFSYKDEVLHSLLRLIIFAAIKIRQQQTPLQNGEEYPNRLSTRFMELLDSQFPIDSPIQSLQHKSAGDFAAQLFVHVNHLNHSLKETIGKSTTQIINERMTAEAIDMLQHTDWSVTEVAYSLGFDYPQHFTTFLKKQTGKNPRQFRTSLV